jgi:hypothetical protein
MNPRRAPLVGLVFVAFAFLLWLVPTLTDGVVMWAGIVMLLGLAAAMSLMATVLISGISRG